MIRYLTLIGAGGSCHAHNFKAAERRFGDQISAHVPDLLLRPGYGVRVVMEKHVVTPSWALFLAFAVFTAIIRHDPHPKRGALER